MKASELSRKNKLKILADGLASICNELVIVGLGDIELGKLAEYLLKFKTK